MIKRGRFEIFEVLKEEPPVVRKGRFEIIELSDFTGFTTETIDICLFTFPIQRFKRGRFDIQITQLTDIPSSKPITRKGRFEILTLT